MIHVNEPYHTFRSRYYNAKKRIYPGDEMVYIEDLKSSVCDGHAGSSPAPGTK